LKELDMTWVACIDTVWWLTNAVKDSTVKAKLRDLHAAHASADEYIEAIVSIMEPEVAAVATRELRELPALTTRTFVEAWAMADAAGKDFAVFSERPEKPIAFARDRRVSLLLDMDNDGVKVTISHISKRHADWYSPANSKA
jgi:hypothetical protein